MLFFETNCHPVANRAPPRCRMSAVHGGTYILGRSITSIVPLSEKNETSQSRYQIIIDGMDSPVYTSCIIGTSEGLRSLHPQELQAEKDTPSPSLVRAVLILEHPLNIRGLPEQHSNSRNTDSVMVIIPPGVVEGGRLDHSISFLITGEGSLSTPPGKGRELIMIRIELITRLTSSHQVILYGCAQISNASQEDPESILRPYITSLLALDESPTPPPCLFELFYREDSSSDSRKDLPYVFTVTKPLPAVATFAEAGDAAAKQAAELFWMISKQLHEQAGIPIPESMWSHDPSDEDAGGDEWA